MPLAKVDWRIHAEERRTIIQIALVTRDAFKSAGLPEPMLEQWVVEDRPEDAVIIDMAHTLGTTRMSNNLKSGVVDENCQVAFADSTWPAGRPFQPAVSCERVRPG
jgi:hypothetical protein